MFSALPQDTLYIFLRALRAFVFFVILLWIS